MNTKKPYRPKSGDRVLQSFYDSINSILDYLPSLEVTGDNQTIFVNHHKSGTTISGKKFFNSPNSVSVENEEPSREAIMCKITSHLGDNRYNVALYANGMSQSSTGTAQITILDYGVNSVIPNGTWIIGHYMNIETLRGSNQ